MIYNKIIGQCGISVHSKINLRADYLLFAVIYNRKDHLTNIKLFDANRYRRHVNTIRKHSTKRV